MIVNVYLNKGKVIHSLVDEVTKHRRGDIFTIRDNRYVVTDITEYDHYDYLTIVRINYIAEKSADAEDNIKELI